MIKKELRKLFREKRNALADAERVKLDDLLLIQFQTVALPFISTLLSYQPIEENKEPNTHLFSGYLSFGNPGLLLAYPRIDLAKNEMEAIAITPATNFIKTPFNIHEPDSSDRMDPRDIDMILVPLLAFDKKGYRVGYGKGYYDKFLATCRKDCIKAGFSYFPPVDSISDRNEFDVPLNLCITPQTVYVF